MGKGDITCNRQNPDSQKQYPSLCSVVPTASMFTQGGRVGLLPQALNEILPQERKGLVAELLQAQTLEMCPLSYPRESATLPSIVFFFLNKDWFGIHKAY